MNLKQILLAAIIGVATLASSNTIAQTFSVSEEVAVVGSSSVSASWSWGAGSDVTGFGVDIVFDASLLTPQTTTVGVAETVDGCLANVPSGVSLKSCNLINSTTIRVSLQNLGTPAAPVASVSPGGTITFDIASTTEANDSSALTASLASVVPAGTSVTLVNGKVDITAAPAPAISVSPTSATIAAANGSTNTQTFTVTNSGNDDGLLVNAPTIVGTNAANFTVTSNTCLTAAPGVAEDGTCNIVVTFAPNSVGSFSATLNITSNGGSSSIALTGTGTLGPVGAITVTPASTFDFGELLTGEEDATQVFTATNTGAAGSTVTIGSAVLNTLTGSPFSITANTCTASLELGKNESCVVTVKFEPTSDGEATRTLTVSGTDANSTSVTDSSAMKGTGISEARPTANPASGASESEVVGPEGSNDFTVVFGNTGNISYDVACSLASTDNTSVWSVANGGTTTVAAGASHTVTTTCALPDTETYTATLSCAIGSTQTFTYSYECVGLPPLPVPVDNKWALLLLALMMLMAASFGFRFMARQ